MKTSNGSGTWALNFPVSLLAMSGMEFLPEYTAVTPPMKRGHRVKGGGRDLFNVMMNTVKAEKNIKTVLGAQVTRPIVRPSKADGGYEVVGVQVVRRGKEMNIRARKAVVLRHRRHRVQPRLYPLAPRLLARPRRHHPHRRHQCHG